jgi:hypothetical protein
MIINGKESLPKRVMGLSYGAVGDFSQVDRRFSSSSWLGFGRENFLLNAIFPYAPHALGAEK